MSFVLAQKQSWPLSDPLTPVVLGPFPSLRDGVTGIKDASEHVAPLPSADFFMWEQFTTKPYFHASSENPSPPLKKVSEIFTPWPSWHIAASTSTFPTPANDTRLTQLLAALDSGIAAFQADTDHAIKLLGTGELGCRYTEADAKEWLKDVRFAQSGTRGVNKAVVENVVDVLKVAGVVPKEITTEEAVKRVAPILK